VWIGLPWRPVETQDIEETPTRERFDVPHANRQRYQPRITDPQSGDADH